MTQTLTGLFDNYDDARRAVQDLEAAGVPHRDIAIVANNAHGGHDGLQELRGDGDHARTADDAGQDAAQDAGKGAGLGATVGGVGGLLAGLGLLAIPGLGPVVAAGWLASTAIGAAGGALLGGAAGGLVGALTHAGVTEDDAHLYAEGVRRGGTLVTAKVDPALAPTARAVLTDERTVDVVARRDAYRTQGWSRFDVTAPAYTADQISSERRLYRI